MFVRPPILTTRQRELLEFLAAGATRNEIAQHFGISPETVKIHTRAILEKFDAKTVRDAIEYIRGTVSEIDSSIDYPGEIFDVLLNGGSPDKTENFGNISNIPKYWIARTVRVTRLNAACITKPKLIAPNIAKRSQIRLARLWVNY
ncbi:MAG: LuxR family transcriptional regulator [Rhodobacteraceae bacterium]|nr:LuxR family transcriptional regulator [Paracoccaceae bacterium]